MKFEDLTLTELVKLIKEKKVTSRTGGKSDPVQYR